MNIIDEKLISAYVILVLSDKLGDRIIPSKYEEVVNIRVSEKTIDTLEGDVIVED